MPYSYTIPNWESSLPAARHTGIYIEVSYRNALPHDVALAELVSNAGRQFDPGVVQALVDLVDRPAGGVRPSPTEQLNLA